MSLAKLKTMSAVLVTLAVLLGVPAALAFSGHADEVAKGQPAPRAAAPETSPEQAKQEVPERALRASRKQAGLPAEDEQKVAATLTKITREQADLEMLDLDAAHAKEQLLKALTRVAELALEPNSLGDANLKEEGRRALLDRWERDRKVADQDVEQWRERYREKSQEATNFRTRLDLIAKPGDMVLVEVLEALPGRPISGSRMVGPSGLLSLGFYGEVQVAGLTNRQMKVKVIERLRKKLNEDVLGLVELDSETRKEVQVDPADSDRVYVEIDLTHSAPRAEATPPRLDPLEQKLNSLNNKLDKLLKAKE